MKTLTRLVYFVSLFLLYIVIRELVELFVITYAVHPVLGYITLLAIAGFIGYFVVTPIVRIFRIPQNPSPTSDESKKEEVIQKRLQRFQSNPFLLGSGFDFTQVTTDEGGYQKIIGTLQKQAEQVRKKYVLQLFYSSSISQNGFLDAILILSSSVNLVKELFVLYHGRVSNKDLWAISKRVYLSMAIGGSEGVEYAAQEIFSKFATEGFRSVPFAEKIFGSLADGFVNAALLTRISLITENYCKLVFIKSEKDLYPSAEFILKTTKFITGDIIDKMILDWLKMSRDKTVDYVKMAVNPVAHLFSTSFGKVVEGTNKFAIHQMEMIKDVGRIANRPVMFGINRLASIFRKGSG